MKFKLPRLVTLVLLLTAVAVGLLWWQGERSQAQLREQVMAQADQRSQHLADAMAGQVGNLLSTLDLALQQLRYLWLQNPQQFPALARDLLQALPEGFVSHLSVVNAQGDVVFDSLGAGEGVYVGDRPHFRAHLDGGDRLVIGEPVRARLTQRWLFVAGRPVLRDGRFDGVVHLLVSTDFLAAKLAALQLSERDIVALVHASGAFMARNLDHEQAMGERVPPDRPFLLQPEQRSGTYRTPGRLDGVARTYGWHRLPGGQAVLAVGLADASVLAPLEPVLGRTRAVTAVLSLLLLAGGGWVAWLLWRMERSRQGQAQSEELLKEAQRLARVGHWSVDHRTQRMTWSQEGCRLLGLDPADPSITFAHFQEQLHPDDRERVLQAFDASAQAHGLFDVESRLLVADGEVRHVHALGEHSFKGDRLVRSSGTVQDITETRSAQLALQELNQSLERRVRERTRELASLNRELEAFAYSVSHDLRTPLRSIHGFASLLAEEGAGLPDEAREHLRRIQDAARRMGVLITDLLSMAHHGRAPVNHQRVNLSAMAHTVAAELEREAPQRRVQWAIEDGLIVQADPTLMRVVLQNLLGNAWKYTGQTAQPCIELRRVAHADGMQTFCVRDNGAGFDMAYADQLFQPFKRLHAPHQFEGSGVGLATVQRVVQRHGGQVHGEGAVGQGASICFSLPDVPVEPPPTSVVAGA